jgi:protein-tyrosine phosphatase
VTEHPPFTDIHCHLLPAIDDGAADREEALAMARLAAADGIVTAVVTPHQLGCYSRNRGAEIRQRTEQLQQLLDRQGVAVHLLPGAEIRVEPGLAGRLHAGEILSLADRRRHVLVELPADVYLPLERVVAELCAAGIQPVLAHPERNAGILARPEILARLHREGCLLQITAGSLTGRFGPHAQRLAGRLVREGLAHCVASDAHGAQSRQPRLAEAFECVRRLAGWETASRLFCSNPARIAAGAPACRAPACGWPEGMVPAGASRGSAPCQRVA